MPVSPLSEVLANRMSPPFTSEYAYKVLQQACQTVGEAAEGATMLRLGENAIFRLAGRSSSIVVRVARDLTRLEIARRELCVSRWLGGAGKVPAVRVHEEIPDQPIVVVDHPITFWEYMPVSADRPNPVDLAVLLRALHATSDSPCDLPEFERSSGVRHDDLAGSERR